MKWVGVSRWQRKPTPEPEKKALKKMARISLYYAVEKFPENKRRQYLPQKNKNK